MCTYNGLGCTKLKKSGASNPNIKFNLKKIFYYKEFQIQVEFGNLTDMIVFNIKKFEN